MRRVRINSQKRAMIFDGHKTVRQVRNDQILAQGFYRFMETKDQKMLKPQ